METETEEPTEALTEFCDVPEHGPDCQHGLIDSMMAAMVHDSSCFLDPPPDGGDHIKEREDWALIIAAGAEWGRPVQCNTECKRRRYANAVYLVEHPNARWLPVHVVHHTPASGVPLLDVVDVEILPEETPAPEPERIGRPKPLISLAERARKGDPVAVP